MRWQIVPKASRALVLSELPIPPVAGRGADGNPLALDRQVDGCLLGGIPARLNVRAILRLAHVKAERGRGNLHIMLFAVSMNAFISGVGVRWL